MSIKLFVSGLNTKATDSSLKHLFSKAGTVESTEIVRDENTSLTQGYGFVVISNEEEAEKAILLLDGILFHGRSITVYKARPRIVRNQPLETENKIREAESTLPSS